MNQKNKRILEGWVLSTFLFVGGSVWADPQAPAQLEQTHACDRELQKITLQTLAADRKFDRLTRWLGGIHSSQKDYLRQVKVVDFQENESGTRQVRIRAGAMLSEEQEHDLMNARHTLFVGYGHGVQPALEKLDRVIRTQLRILFFEARERAKEIDGEQSVKVKGNLRDEIRELERRAHFLSNSLYMRFDKNSAFQFLRMILTQKSFIDDNPDLEPLVSKIKLPSVRMAYFDFSLHFPTGAELKKLQSSAVDGNATVQHGTHLLIEDLRSGDLERQLRARRYLTQTFFYLEAIYQKDPLFEAFKKVFLLESWKMENPSLRQKEVALLFRKGAKSKDKETIKRALKIALEAHPRLKETLWTERGTSVFPETILIGRGFPEGLSLLDQFPDDPWELFFVRQIAKGKRALPILKVFSVSLRPIAEKLLFWAIEFQNYEAAALIRDWEANAS